ncbi:MAG TPA: hypothetical protein VKU01_24010 [Bryobacteraceae bacterium]|nr:hypothetical protein [Bryobacteraceae bacterium]
MLACRQIGRLWTITQAATVAVEQHTLMIDNAQRLYANSLYQVASKGMQSGIYPPRRSSFLCSRKHCAFVRQCVSEWGGEVD